MSSVSNILKCVTQLQRLAKELEEIAQQVTTEAQLAQDAHAREEIIREETGIFLERLGTQRKRSGSANSSGTSSKKAVALSVEQDGGQIRVAVPPEKPKATIPATAGVACQGPSCNEGSVICSGHQKATLAQVVDLLYKAKGPKKGEQELQTYGGPCADFGPPGPPFKPSRSAKRAKKPSSYLGSARKDQAAQANRYKTVAN